MNVARRRALTAFLALGSALTFLPDSAAAVANRDREKPEFVVPPYVGAYQPQGTDEQGQWLQADEAERTIRDLPVVIQDEELNAYVRSVLCRAVGNDRCGSARIYILRLPVFNATMSANGTMHVYSGLLLRVRNEGELASILAHEFAHFELRHSLTRFRARRSASDALAWASVLVGFSQNSGLRYGTSFQDLLYAVHGSLAAYNRNQEREADLLSFAYTTQSQFRPSASADVWRAVMNESDASAVARGQRTNRYGGVPFLASHPSDLERADTLSLMANRILSAGDYDGREQYRTAMARWIPEFLSDQIKLNDFGGTEFIIARLASDGWTADLHYARAELYRTRGNPRDLISAIGFYREALALNPQMHAAKRGLGLSLIRSGSVAEGRIALQAFLEAQPDALDAAMLRTLIQP